MSTSQITNARAIRFLLSYMKKYWPVICIGITLIIVVDIFQLVIPRIIKNVLDALGGQAFSQQLVQKNAVYIILLAAGMVILRFFWRICIFMPSRKIETGMRDDLFSHLTNLPFSFFNTAKTGDLMAILINDLSAVRMATGPALIGITDAIFMGSLSLAFMMSISVKLTLITIMPLPAILFLFIKFGGRIQSKFNDIQASFGKLSSHTQEVFSGIRVVKGFAREESELDSFSAGCNEYVDKNIRLVRLWGVIFPLVSLFASLSFAILLILGGIQVMTNRLSLGNFVSFSFYIELFIWPLMAIGWVFNIFQRGIASSKRILELLDQRSDIIVSVSKSSSPTELKGHIVMRDLTFKYSGKETNALEGINLNIPAGGSLGIIGKPGSGKTTLASLLFHLFPIERGRLFIDGSDINDIHRDILRKSIGYVPQDSFLFSDTIENNIAFGSHDSVYSHETILDAARIASIEKDISGFPLGFSTMVGERGITLSGGQKQRIAIARAILSKPPILIFDDALSSVDAGTEREIKNAIEQEMQGRTTLIIAHRISTIRSCNTIIVLECGKISELGSHDELVEKNGFYAKLHALQKMKDREA